MNNSTENIQKTYEALLKLNREKGYVLFSDIAEQAVKYGLSTVDQSRIVDRLLLENISIEEKDLPLFSKEDVSPAKEKEKEKQKEIKKVETEPLPKEDKQLHFLSFDDFLSLCIKNGYVYLNDLEDFVLNNDLSSDEIEDLRSLLNDLSISLSDYELDFDEEEYIKNREEYESADRSELLMNEEIELYPTLKMKEERILFRKIAGKKEELIESITSFNCFFEKLEYLNKKAFQIPNVVFKSFDMDFYKRNLKIYMDNNYYGEDEYEENEIYSEEMIDSGDCFQMDEQAKELLEMLSKKMSEIIFSKDKGKNFLTEKILDIHFSEKFLNGILEHIYSICSDYKKHFTHIISFCKKTDLEYEKLRQLAYEALKKHLSFTSLLDNKNSLILEKPVELEQLFSAFKYLFFVENENNLTSLEILSIGKRIKNAFDEILKTKEIIVKSNLRLIKWNANRFRNVCGNMDFMDLFQGGYFGLSKAIDKFDPNRGLKFSTYASSWIRQSISRSISDFSRIIRIPVHMGELIRKLGKTSSLFFQVFDREPTLEELSSLSDISIVKVRKALKLVKEPISLDVPLNDDDDICLGDLIEDKNVVQPLDIISQKDLHDLLKEILSHFSSRMEQVVRMRFGIDLNTDYTLEEIGQKYFVTRERIRQIEAKAIRILKHPKYSRLLRSFLDSEQ